MAEGMTPTPWHGLPVPKITHATVSSARWLAIHVDVVRTARARGATPEEVFAMYGVTPAEQASIVRAGR